MILFSFSSCSNETKKNTIKDKRSLGWFGKLLQNKNRKQDSTDHKTKEKRNDSLERLLMKYKVGSPEYNFLINHIFKLHM